MDDITARLASAVRKARTGRDLSVATLADRSGVSRAMIGKIERGDVQPTAALLGRLTGALGMTLSGLIASAEGDERRIARASETGTWTDPATGYTRRAVSPPAGGPLDLVEVDLPAGQQVHFDASSYTGTHHQIWVLGGRLRFLEGAEVHELGPGDCLQLGPPTDCAYVNATDEPCRYLVALVKLAR